MSEENGESSLSERLRDVNREREAKNSSNMQERNDSHRVYIGSMVYTFKRFAKPYNRSTG